MESTFRKARNTRSSGPDGLPDELISLFPYEFGRAFGPVFFKALLRFDMPLQQGLVAFCTNCIKAAALLP